jgi:hypothetical protein
VPEDYGGLLSLTKKLSKHLSEHDEQTNDKPKVKVTAERADELNEALRTAKTDLDAHDTLIDDKLKEQGKALAALRRRLCGLRGELRQILELNDQRWHRFGLNAPAEPETPDQPEDVQVNNTMPGTLLVSCPTVPFAERFRFFIQKVGTTGEPVAVGSSSAPLFAIENVEPGARYNVFVSAVNLAGNEGPRSKAVAAEVIARAA